MASDPQLLSLSLQRALAEAQQVLDAARRRYAQQGLDPEDTRAELERKLSAQELDQVHAEVEAQLQHIARNAYLAAAEPPPERVQRHPPSII